MLKFPDNVKLKFQLLYCGKRVSSQEVETFSTKKFIRENGHVRLGYLEHLGYRLADPDRMGLCSAERIHATVA